MSLENLIFLGRVSMVAEPPAQAQSDQNPSRGVRFWARSALKFQYHILHPPPQIHFFKKSTLAATCYQQLGPWHNQNFRALCAQILAPPEGVWSLRSQTAQLHDWVGASPLGVVIMHIIYKFNMWAILCDFNGNFIADFGHFQFWGVSEAQHNGPEGGN